jgi:hypothetical protein
LILLAACASPEGLSPQKFKPSGPQCGHGALDSDAHNCGQCGHDCTQLAGVASATCVQGVCQLVCDAGRAHCSANSDDGCEADLSSPATCGSCMNKCANVCAPSGTSFACQDTCTSGMNCNGQCVDVSSDPDNCGGCGHACAQPQNGKATCSSNQCGITCDSGFQLDNGACVSQQPAGSWTPLDSNTTNALYAIWGSPAGDLFVTGDKGTVLTAKKGGALASAMSASSNQLFAVWGIDTDHVLSVGWNISDRGGAVFRPQMDGSWSGGGFVTSRLSGAWGSSFTDVYSVGDNGTILHTTNGHSWSNESSGTSQSLWSIWGSAADDLYAVGDNGTIRRGDGLSWSHESSGTHQSLFAVWGASSSDVWVVGAGGLILHSSGDGNWSSEDSGTTEDLAGLGGAGVSDVWAVGAHGTIIHRAGGMWTAESSGTTRDLWALWASTSDGAFAVGDVGTILHR